ncbi:MAG: hypothetical protein JWN40_3826 [Phycisphaerales bacterium]|nr:hypothetical protein [Phycisphaerales bacterium]
MSNGTTTQTLTFTSNLHLQRHAKGRLEMWTGEVPARSIEQTYAGRVPRIARLMALAIRFEDLVRRGEVQDYADLARLGHVTRARVSQIMNLLMLAPELQEQILYLPPVEFGRDPLKEWQVRSVAKQPIWAKQRRRWRALGLPLAHKPPIPSVLQPRRKH